MDPPVPENPAAALLDGHPDSALLVDPDGRIRWANAAARRWLSAPDGSLPPTLEALGLTLHTTGPDEGAHQEADLTSRGGAVTRCRVTAGALVQGRRLVMIAAVQTVAATMGTAHVQLAAAVELGQIAIWRHDYATARVHCNAVGLRMLGRPPAPEGLPLVDVLALAHRDDLAALRASKARSLESTSPVDFEIRIRRTDGGWCHLLTRRVVERDLDGVAIASSGVSIDVSVPRGDARRTKEIMRRFDLLAGAAAIGHWSLERGSDEPHWSEHMYTMHGLAPGTRPPPTGEWLRTFVHERDRARVEREMFEWVRSGEPSIDSEFSIVRTDGRVVQVSTHSRSEPGVPRPLLFGLLIDITERRAAESALRQAADRAALIANGVGLGTWSQDLVTGESMWDEQMWRLRGLEPRPGALSRAERMAIVHPDDLEAAGRIHAQMMQDRAPIDHEFRVQWPDGSWRWLASRSIAVGGADGGPARRIGVNWDITEARSAAAERQERVAAQRDVLAKSQFLSRMSHELRTPLNAVLGFTQLLLADGATDDPAVRLRRLEHIQSAGRHLLTLIDDVLDLSRLEGGEAQIALEPTPLQAIVTEVLSMVEPMARECSVRIETAGVDTVPLVDPTRLRQVLLNLLTNAIKYNRTGGHVMLRSRQGPDVVVIELSDTGHGMSAHQMSHLFEPFNRLGAETTSVEGTGIGLAIVKALVERMGGTVSVESTLGKGTRFELRLIDGSHTPPAVGELARPQAMALAATVGSVGRGGRVLYIEDNPVNTIIVGELIAQRQDLTLLTATTGQEGLEIARTQRPDLILLDMQLPDINGPEVFARLQSEPRTARIPCIALSANAIQADIDEAMRSGFADYWTKPLDFKTFIASMDAMFGPSPA